MAKVGMPSFLLDTVLDEKWELLEARYGLKGFSVVVKLFQRIYGTNGYYCEWNDDISLVFAKRIGLDASLVSEIVSYAMKLCLFDKELFDRSSILTSLSIQKNFLSFYKRREAVEVESSFLHTQISKTVYKNIKIVNKMSKIVNNLGENANQIKVNEIKVNEIKVNEIKVNEIKEDETHFPDNELVNYWESKTASTLSSNTIEIINNISKFNDHELIKYAMDLTIEKKIKSIEYARAILINWAKEGLKTKDEVIKNHSGITKMTLPEYYGQNNTIPEVESSSEDIEALKNRIKGLKT